MVGGPGERLDQARVWLIRVLAPVAFVVAAVALVVVVQRALDNGSSSEPAGPADTFASVPVTTEPAETDTVPAEPKFYRIKAGDTLEAIAAEFDTSVDRLLELNPEIDQLALQPGERIRVA